MLMIADIKQAMMTFGEAGEHRNVKLLGAVGKLVIVNLIERRVGKKPGLKTSSYSNLEKSPILIVSEKNQSQTRF